MLESEGVTLVLEPLNTTVDHPGYYLERTPEGLDIVEEVNSRGVKLLYDSCKGAKCIHNTCRCP